MEKMNLRKGLFGYTESSVVAYIEAINGEMKARIQKLTEENDGLRERCELYESEKNSANDKQELEFYFKFIGKFEIPTHEPTTAELAEMAEKERLRLRNREYGRRYREKKKAEKITAQKAAEQQKKTEKKRKQADEKSA